MGYIIIIIIIIIIMAEMAVITGTYVEEGIALFLELVIRPHQQFKRYDMEFRYTRLHDF